MRTFKSLTCAVAAMTLALGGVAHAAGTQSSEALPQASSADGVTVPAEKKKKKRAGGIWLGALALVAVAGGVAMIGDSGSDTPG